MTDWPHAPSHRLSERGTYMVTSGTYGRVHHLRTRDRLDLVQDHLLSIAAEYGWELQAWAVLSNHYHFVAASPQDAATLRKLIGKLHTLTARALNEQDGTPGRRVWYQYFDSRITHHTSYLARLKYVHQNPVHHVVAEWAENYPWCSAAWFARTAEASFQKVVGSFKTDQVRVMDEFEPCVIEKAASSRRTPDSGSGAAT